MDLSVVVDYPRFVRTQAQFSFVVYPSPAVIADEKVKLEINDKYLDKFFVEAIVPQPSSEATTARGKVFEFDVSGDQTSPGIKFFLRPTGVGLAEALINMADGKLISFRQFIYP